MDIDLDNLAAHPFADVFPMMPDAELGELADGIANNGLLEPIVLYDGAILDGRNRYAAGNRVGMQWIGFSEDGTSPHFVMFGGSEVEAAKYVRAKNIERRHLSKHERAVAAAEFLILCGDHGGGAEEAAALHGVSVGEVRRAKRVKTEGPANLQQMVADGLPLLHAETLMRELPASDIEKLPTIERARGKAKELLSEKRPSLNKSRGKKELQRPDDLADQIHTLLDEIARREILHGSATYLTLERAQQRLAEILDAITATVHDEASAA